MPDVPYETAVNEALERLEHAGFFLGSGGPGNQLRGFAIHAPMGAEALAALGHGDMVPAWVDGYAARRGFGAPPDPYAPIEPADPASWKAALGETRRLADWATLFRRQIDDAGWQATLADWWPRLAPGMMAGLTHGLIRTAHAVRSASAVAEPSPLQLHEIANGLAFWAAMYQLPSSAMARGARAIGAVRTLGRRPADKLFASADALLDESVDAAVAELGALSAGRYLKVSGRVPVPAIHTVTAPAALRLVLPLLPPEMGPRSYEAIRDVCGTLLNLFAAGGPDDVPEPAVDGADPTVQQRVLDAAVELGDEHGIKISEAARREFADHPDPRYFAAAHHAVTLLGGSPG